MLESDCFDSVQELVRFYVGQRKPLSQSCAAHIYCPVSRTLPLRYLEATFALASSKHGSAYSPSTQRGAHIKRRSVTMTDGLTTEKMIPHRWARMFCCVVCKHRLLTFTNMLMTLCYICNQWLRQSQSSWDTGGTTRTKPGKCAQKQVVLVFVLARH